MDLNRVLKLRLREKVFWERNINRKILTFCPRRKRTPNKCRISNCLLSYVGDVLWFTLLGQIPWDIIWVNTENDYKRKESYMLRRILKNVLKDFLNI